MQIYMRQGGAGTAGVNGFRCGSKKTRSTALVHAKSGPSSSSSAAAAVFMVSLYALRN